MASRDRDRVRFNVGGQLFETTSTTLANAGRHSMLGALLDSSWQLPHPHNNNEEEECYFIDRNPACFSVLLDLLRTGALHIPSHVPERLFYREALYYGLLDRVRAVKWGPFDGNTLRLADSVPGRAPGDGTAIRAAPDGGCCVAHGSVVHVYNWMLEERKPVSLDYQQVNDVGYIDADSIVITARERLGKGDGGMAVFSAATGDLQHRFRVEHGGQQKTFTAGALSLAGPDDHRIFSSCKGRLNEYGIGVWDHNTGQQVDFFYEHPGCSLGDADKLQWLPSKNCLMVATLFPRTDNCFIGLLDFRDKTIPWSWSDAGIAVTLEDKRVLHAIAMDDDHSICVINQYDDLGFIDLRAGTTNSAGTGVRWSSRSKLMNRKIPYEESCYPKLATHNGQLFSCMNDSISVFSGSEHVLTSTLRRSYGGSICDFSIGGDRLFALHNEENVFDVWESPPSPII